MPSDTLTPAQLRWTGRALATSHEIDTLTPASLRWNGGALLETGDIPALSLVIPKLDNLTRFDDITANGGPPSQRFQRIWQDAMQAITNAFEAVNDRDSNQEAILASIQAAMTLAQAANDTAQTTAVADALAKSYVSPLNIISATSGGVITISAHTRIYGDGSSVAVNGGSVSGFAPSSYVQIYYDDAGRSGGAVTYQGTMSVIAQEGARHIVGGVTIPLVGVPPMSGYPPFPPGYVPDPNQAAVPV
jgi:hypothetical protein